jgi:hypothetical protein
VTILCITPGPSHEYSRKPDSRPTRWCFKCRKHLPHEIVVIGDPPEVMSYYEPIAKIECPRCRGEHVLFPGREWVYPEDERVIES